MWDKQHDRVTNDRENIECDEGATKSPAIDRQPARVCVNRAKQRPDRIERPDNEDCRAKRLKIFRDEAHPQFLAGADREDCDQQNDEVAPQPEEFREWAPPFHKQHRDSGAILSSTESFELLRPHGPSYGATD
jgi:hypothetical protein